MPFDRRPVLYVDDVAPLMGEVVLPLVPRYHWYVTVPLPLATTLSVAEVFLAMVTEAGCVLIVVASRTVTLVAAEVDVQPFASVTVTL